MWCKQLTQTVGNCLLEFVNDKQNPRLKFDLPLSTRLAIAKKHFLSSPTYHKLILNDTLTFSKDYLPVVKRGKTLLAKYQQPIEIIEPIYQFSSKSRPKSDAFQIDLNKMRKKGLDSLFISSNINQLEYFIYGIRNASELDQIVDLSNQIETLPYIRKTERHVQEENIDPIIPHTIVYLNERELLQYQSIIIAFDREALSWFDLRMIINNFDSKKIWIHSSNAKTSLLHIAEYVHENGIHILHLPILGRQFSYRIQVSNCENQRLLLPSSYYFYKSNHENGHLSFEERFIENATDFNIKFFSSANIGQKNDFIVYLFTDPSCPTKVSLFALLC